MAPRWSNASHHILQTSMKHITDPIFSPNFKYDRY
jgi:hypothetical protein